MHSHVILQRLSSFLLLLTWKQNISCFLAKQTKCFSHQSIVLELRMFPECNPVKQFVKVEIKNLLLGSIVHELQTTNVNFASWNFWQSCSVKCGAVSNSNNFFSKQFRNFSKKRAQEICELIKLVKKLSSGNPKLTFLTFGQSSFEFQVKLFPFPQASSFEKPLQWVVGKVLTRL